MQHPVRLTRSRRVSEGVVNLEGLLTREVLVAVRTLDRQLARVDLVGVALQVGHLDLAIEANPGAVNL